MPLNEPLGWLIDRFAGLAEGALEKRLARVALRLSGDLPKLAGPWIVTFDDPAPAAAHRRGRVHVVLRQWGRRVLGRGHLEHRIRHHPREVPRPPGQKENVPLLHRVAFHGGRGCDPNQTILPIGYQFLLVVEIPNLDYPVLAVRSNLHPPPKLEALLNLGYLTELAFWGGGVHTLASPYRALSNHGSYRSTV